MTNTTTTMTRMLNKTNITLLLAFATVFGAGAVIGMARHSGQHENQRLRGSWLRQELDLTDEQHEKMRSIWSEVMSSQQGRNGWEKRRELQKEREQALAEMLTPEQKERYAQVNAEYDRKVAELGEARRKSFQQAIDRTKEILSPEQAAKYDQFLKRRGRGGVPRPFESRSSSATQPTG
jgi:Spy/CpxP family protein refolding chaperone